MLRMPSCSTNGHCARLHQILRGLRWSHPVEAAAWQDLATRAKWRLWHGQHFRVLEALEEFAKITP
jgi:hypothetical protein